MTRAPLFIFFILFPTFAQACIWYSSREILKEIRQSAHQLEAVAFGAYFLDESLPLLCSVIELEPGTRAFERVNFSDLNPVQPVYKGNAYFEGYVLRPNQEPLHLRQTFELSFQGPIGQSCQSEHRGYIYNGFQEASGYGQSVNLESGEPVVNISASDFDYWSGSHDHLGCYSRHGEVLNMMADFTQACMNQDCPLIPIWPRDSEVYNMGIDQLVPDLPTPVPGDSSLINW